MTTTRAMDIVEYNIANSPSPTQLKRIGLVKEWRAVFQFGRLGFNYRSLVKNKQGKGERIILLPGFMSWESSMSPIKHFLHQIGYHPEYWGLGTKKGNVEYYRDRMLEKLEQEKGTEKITFVGWSLGGVIAREVARVLPERTSSVFTFGSPIKGPGYTAAADMYKESEIQRISALQKKLDRTNPIQVPMSIIFSKKDTIVSWPSCLDSTSKNVKHYEVHSTHLSMVIDPVIWKLLALHLEEHLGA